jgi:Domain of unknown function (DUF4395)
MAVQLLIGLTLGRRFCIPCVFYFTVIQPRVGEGPLEDSRAPRFANMIGIVTLTAAAALFWLGADAAATVVAAIVAGLALLSAFTGLCAGCELYRLLARARGVSATHFGRLDPDDLPGLDRAPRAYVEFTHPLCSECRDWEHRLAGGDDPFIRIDVSHAPELARKYGIAIVPTVLAVGPDGAVLERLAP